MADGGNQHEQETELEQAHLPHPPVVVHRLLPVREALNQYTIIATQCGRGEEKRGNGRSGEGRIYNYGRGGFP